MSEIFIEAESFAEKGGWVVEQQSFETLGSAYLMAHGMGAPVKDATTKFTAPKDGVYKIWARTRDWTAVWGVKDPAGKFYLRVDGEKLPQTLGVCGAEWHWQFVGEKRLTAGEHSLALCDATGFNGRCDALYFSTEDAPPANDRAGLDDLRKRLNWQEIETVDEPFDIIVVGGGIAGICTAVAAMRSKLNVLLINDRKVLGGCNSSEIRVCQGGMIHLPPYEKLGNVAQEIAPVMGEPWVYEPQYFEDFRKLAVFEPQSSFWRYGKHTIALGERVTEVETDGGKIVAVVTTDVETGKKKRYKATLFSDCSGDGTLARLAGAETMYGRESRAEYGETLAPERAEKLVMGHSVRWCSEDVGKETEFPELDWNMPFTDENCLDVFCGDWEQETGFRRDMVVDIEYIRDYGLRAIYANWSFQKNAFKDREKYKNYRLKWVSPLGGKRESYRVKGDLVLTQQDIEEHKFYEDQTACITWSIDMHFPETDNEKEFGEAFRSFAYHRGIVSAYPVPYRCLYSKDISNLFLGGRIVSCSHVAFSAVRVMRTLGMLGEVVGLAAGLCKRFSCAPRDIYTAHLADLKAAMQKGVDVPAAFEGAPADDESYHFKDLGWVWIHNGKIPMEKKALEKIARNVQKLGLSHKYGLPKPLENTEEKPE